MEKKYEINSMSGDHPLENQRYWIDLFDTKEEAIAAALIQHAEMIKSNPLQEIHTMVFKEEKDQEVDWLIFNGIIYDDPVEATIKADELEFGTRIEE